MEEAVIVPWDGRDRAGEWACLWAGMGRGPERSASTAGMGMQLLGGREGEGQVSQKATSSSEYISVVKGAESSLANWGRGWLGPPLPYIQVSHPTWPCGELQALPRLRWSGWVRSLSSSSY